MVFCGETRHANDRFVFDEYFFNLFSNLIIGNKTKKKLKLMTLPFPCIVFHVTFEIVLHALLLLLLINYN